MTPHPNALQLDTFAAATSEKPADPAVQAHVDGCDACRTEVEATRASHARFKREIFPRTLPAIERRTAPFKFSWVVLVPVLGAAAFVLVPRSATMDDSAVLAKGSEGLEIVLKRDGRVQRVDAATRFRAGDELRFVAFPGGATHALLVSIDARGTRSVYAPFDAEAALAIPASPRAELPGSVVLDDAPGPERLFLLLAKRPFTRAELAPGLDAYAAAGPDALRTQPRLSLATDDIVQVSRLLEKAVVTP